MSTENKVRVTRLLGGGAAQGVMNAKVGMVTHQGTIITINNTTTYTVSVSGTAVGTLKECYPHELFVLEDHASGTHAWPTGDGSVLFGRSITWPDGVPNPDESGMVYLKGDGIPTAFSRP